MATHSSLKSPKPLTSLHLIQIRAWNFGLAEQEAERLRARLPELTGEAAFILVVWLAFIRELYRKGYYRRPQRTLVAWLRSPLASLGRLFTGRRSPDDPEAVLTRAIEPWLDVYRQMTLVELWRKGKAPLVGGIRLLREHPGAQEQAGTTTAGAG